MMSSNAPDPWGTSDTPDEIETVACVNFGDSWTGYTEGFRRAGTILVDYIEAEDRSQDFLVYPIVFSFRHSLEVTIKQVILFGRRLYDLPGDFPDGHDLGNLWNTCCPIVAQVFAHDPDLPLVLLTVRGLVDEIQAIDPGGTAFRYPLGTKKLGERAQSLPAKMRTVPLRRFAAEVGAVLDYLDAADSEIRELLSEREMEQDYRQNAADYTVDWSDY